MSTASMTSKGQITVPAIVRSALGLKTGDRVEFVEVTTGQFVMMAATRPVHELKGLIRKPAKAVSIEEMNQAIAHQGGMAR